ncbi:MAG: GAF domain-containing protein [Desulfobacteraceae bacterium]
MDQETFFQNKFERGEFAQKIDVLQACSLFSSLDRRELEFISQSLEEVEFNPETRVITQDVQGDCFYVMIQGEAEVYRIGDYSEKIVLARIRPGDSVGEMGYFASGRRLASVKTLTECQMLKIGYDHLDDFLRSCPGLTKKFLNLITLRLKETNLQFQDTVLKTRKTERTLENMSAILSMSDMSDLKTGVDRLIERIVTTASKALDAERATVFLIDPFSNELWSKVAMGVEKREIRMPLNKGIAGWVARNGQMVNIVDVYEDERFDRTIDSSLGYRTRNMLCGPLKNPKGITIGVIQLINKKGRTFNSSDEKLLTAFAYQTTIAVENFRLCRKIMKEHEKLTVFYEVSSAVAQTNDLDALFRIIVNKISQVLNAQRSSLFLVDKKTDELWSKVAEQSEIKEIRFPMNQGLAGHVATTGEMLNIRNAYEDPRFSPSVDKKTGFKTEMVLCSPVINREGVIIGVVQVINKKKGVFEKEDEELLSAISSQISVGLTTAQLIKNLKELLSAFLKSMASAIDEKSPYTGGHVKRVVSLSMLIAKTINESDDNNFEGLVFDDAQMEELRVAAWMHDIGKIVTPQHVIDKGNKLEKLIDRIEGIETRFQLIETVAENEFLNKKTKLQIQGDSCEFMLSQIEYDFQQKVESLRDDFGFIQSCNRSDFMSDEEVHRINAIAEKTYTFHGTVYPYLTEDEVKNLCVRKGTLTAEERKIVENHVKATEKITRVLPFPENLSRVSEFAASHHEKLDGTGYPNQLSKKNLAVQSRILAIADIFEALTAQDRPYRGPMKLSRAIKIMEFMKKENHIDANIFDLFINSGIYKKYAEKHLCSDQIDITHKEKDHGLG